MERTIEQTYEIAAPPETVFRALTDADELSRWWTTTAESDPRTGGSFDYRWDFEEGAGREDHRQSGRYDDVVANERIVYPWKAGDRDTSVTFSLAPSGTGTALSLAHTGFDDGESFEMHEQGWGFFIANLKRYLESGEDERATMGLKTPAAARG